MSRKKHQTVRDDKLPFYLKDGASAGGRFIQVANSLMLSRRFQALTPNARWVYFSLAMEAGGRKEVTLSHSAARTKYGITKSGYEFLFSADLVRKLEFSHDLKDVFTLIWLIMVYFGSCSARFLIFYIIYGFNRTLRNHRPSGSVFRVRVPSATVLSLR